MNGCDGSRIGRRQFNRWLLAGLAAAACPIKTRGRAAGPTRLRVAAVQMTPKLADAQANLAQAERLVRDAQALDAQWIILPEMFTTAAAFHPDMLSQIQPLNGPAAQMMLRLSRGRNRGGVGWNRAPTTTRPSPGPICRQGRSMNSPPMPSLGNSSGDGDVFRRHDQTGEQA